MQTTIKLNGLDVDIDYSITPAEPSTGLSFPYVEADSISIFRPQKDGSLKEIHQDAYWILGDYLETIAEDLTNLIGD